MKKQLAILAILLSPLALIAADRIIGRLTSGTWSTVTNGVDVVHTWSTTTTTTIPGPVNLVVNGTFATNGAPWTGDGAASASAWTMIATEGVQFQQTISAPIVGRTYRLTYTFARTGEWPLVFPTFGGQEQLQGSVGVNVLDVEILYEDPVISFYMDSGGTGSISAVSLVDITP